MPVCRSLSGALRGRGTFWRASGWGRASGVPRKTAGFWCEALAAGRRRGLRCAPPTPLHPPRTRCRRALGPSAGVPVQGPGAATRTPPTLGAAPHLLRERPDWGPRTLSTTAPTFLIFAPPKREGRRGGWDRPAWRRPTTGLFCACRPCSRPRGRCAVPVDRRQRVRRTDRTFQRQPRTGQSAPPNGNPCRSHKPPARRPGASVPLANVRQPGKGTSPSGPGGRAPAVISLARRLKPCPRSKCTMTASEVMPGRWPPPAVGDVFSSTVTWLAPSVLRRSTSSA